MTFNWPTTGFTGTEVEAFETAYKELAESIYEDYNKGRTDINYLKAPYRQQENIREFLEYGLLYSAFIVKQRAGNSGPGTDFILGSSPRSQLLPHQQGNEDKKTIMRNLGCILESKAMEDCYKQNQENDPGLPDLDWEDGGMRPDNHGDNDDYLDPLLDLLEEDPHPSCVGFLDKWDASAAAKAAAEEFLLNWPQTALAWLMSRLVMKMKVMASGSLSNDPDSVAGALVYLFMVRYLEGIGGVLTKEYINDTIPHPNAHQIIRKNMADMWREWATCLETHGIDSIWCHDMGSLNDDYGNRTPRWYENTNNAGWGMSPGQKRYTVFFKGTRWHNSFGTCQIITDGTPITQIQGENIKVIRDDYDFRFGWEIARSVGVPGDAFDDSEIKSGVFYTSAQTTPCSAAMSNFESKDSLSEMISYLIRQVIAQDHGTGNGDWEDLAAGTTKPFAIKLEW